MAEAIDTINEVENWISYSLEAVHAFQDMTQRPAAKRAAALAATKLEEAEMWFERALQINERGHHD